MGNEKSIRLFQAGRFSHISWVLDIENDKIQQKDFSFIDEVDVISQYWIINNFSGMQIRMNPGKPHDYDIRVIKSCENDSLYIYPISQLHYLIE